MTAYPQQPAPPAQAPEQPTASPQPEPGRRDPEGRRRAILTAATELVIEHGTAALTHRAIAARAGVSLGSTTQYFASIDELRELALQQIAAEIDQNLAEMEATLPDMLGDTARAIVPVHEFLLDRRAVDGELALIASGAVDPNLRELARRWSDRLIAMLTPHIGPTRAAALTVYLDGATVHAALHDEPLGLADLTATVQALLTMPDPSPQGAQAPDPSPEGARRPTPDGGASPGARPGHAADPDHTHPADTNPAAPGTRS